MHIGISFDPERDYVERAQEVSEKFDLVELSVGELAKDTGEIDLERLKEVLDRKGLEPIVHLPFRQPIATTVEEYNRAKLEYYRRLLELASELGAEKAVVHCNLRWGQEKDEVREELRSQIAAIKEQGEETGLEVCFENIFSEETKPAELMEFGQILEELGASMCFDIGHAVAEVGEKDALKFLGEYSHLVSHLHVQDTRNQQDSHLVIGDGEIDFEEFASHLQDFEGTAILEIFTEDAELLEMSRKRLLRHF